MRSTGSEEEPLDVELVGDDDFALSARDDAGLSTRDRKILAFERRWWRYAGAKEQAIRENFGVSAHPLLPVTRRAHRSSRGHGTRPLC